MPAQVVINELVISFGVAFEVGSQLLGAQGRSLLQADSVLKEEADIGCYDKMPRGFGFRNSIEPVHTGVSALVKSQLPKFHDCSLRHDEPHHFPPVRPDSRHGAAGQCLWPLFWRTVRIIAHPRSQPGDPGASPVIPL